MRIVTGVLKGRTIPFSSRRQGAIRFTSSMLKEAVFAMLGADLKGRSFLDLCAGSGQMGLEAYSRGACVELNEPDQRRCAHIRALIREWRLEGMELHGEKAQVLLPRLQAQKRKFHIIYLDPPYHAKLHGQPLSLALLAQLGHSPVLEQEGLIFAQGAKDLDLPQKQGRLGLQRRRGYGQTILGVYQAPA